MKYLFLFIDLEEILIKKADKLVKNVSGLVKTGNFLII